MKDELPATVRFLFQPAEEVGKGAKAVVAQGGMEGGRRFASIARYRPRWGLQCHPGGLPPPPTGLRSPSKAKPAMAHIPRLAWTLRSVPLL